MPRSAAVVVRPCHMACGRCLRPLVDPRLDVGAVLQTDADAFNFVVDADSGTLLHEKCARERDAVECEARDAFFACLLGKGHARAHLNPAQLDAVRDSDLWRRRASKWGDAVNDGGVVGALRTDAFWVRFAGRAGKALLYDRSVLSLDAFLEPVCVYRLDSNDVTGRLLRRHAADLRHSQALNGAHENVDFTVAERRSLQDTRSISVWLTWSERDGAPLLVVRHRFRPETVEKLEASADGKVLLAHLNTSSFAEAHQLRAGARDLCRRTARHVGAALRRYLTVHDLTAPEHRVLQVEAQCASLEPVELVDATVRRTMARLHRVEGGDYVLEHRCVELRRDPEAAAAWPAVEPLSELVHDAQGSHRDHRAAAPLLAVQNPKAREGGYMPLTLARIDFVQNAQGGMSSGQRGLLFADDRRVLASRVVYL